MSGRTDGGASAGDLWQGLKIRMDDRQASYRRSWLRAPLGEPAHRPGGEELASDLNLACELYLKGDEALRREIRDSFERWTAVRGRMLAQAWSFAHKLADTCDDRWLRLGLAAVSIDDNGTDFRDSYVVLGALYISAVRCGMEPGALLRRGRGDLLWYLEHRTGLDAGFPAPFRRVGVLRGVRRTEATVRMRYGVSLEESWRCLAKRRDGQGFS